MSDYIQEAYANMHLQEGPGAIEKLLLECYLNSGISTKELARKLLLPVPLAAAIKKELIKRGVLVQVSGVRCTQEGTAYVERVKGFDRLNRAIYQKVMNGGLEAIPELAGCLAELHGVFQQRPKANVQIDQAKCTVETSIRRAILCLQEHALIGKQILCLGDDDLVSVACGFLLKLLFPEHKRLQAKITVVDIDGRFLHYIEAVATQHGLPIQCCLADLREPLPAALHGRFEGVMTDPPYTLQGLRLFISRGISALQPKIGLPVFLSFAHKPPEVTLAMYREFGQMELMIKSVMPCFNEYEGAEMIGNRGQMILLKTTERTQPAIVGSFQEALYTGEVQRSIRTYRCKRCKESIVVGSQQTFATIEELKQTGCPNCQQAIFELLEKTLSKLK